ncbi:hypothetical protein [Polyangium mundeleinium]|uniref:DUF4234 domain-containing protein n=1 Tax=Polyangium mundeleinium TaxID=2995306 RepID=A0ABT5EP86_9BACT|nr:hypothetical protein [Polyangium mundeleinium]MDC0743657.1 hypothetical protein [Polyangium mundeleinium]
MIGRWSPLTRAYVGLLLVRIALLVAGYGFVLRQYPPWAFLEPALGIVGMTLGLSWLHQTWARIPKPQRQAYDGQRIEPDQAVWKLFIPVYGIYWLFVANTGLCGAIERRLKRVHARSVEVPSTLAFVACLVQLVPVLNLALSPFLWGLFMARADAAQAEADRLDAEIVAPKSLGWLEVLAILGASLLAMWGILIVTFAAIWQFLSPAKP